MVRYCRLEKRTVPRSFPVRPFLQAIHQIRRNDQHFQSSIVQRGDGFANGRLEIPAEDDDTIPAAHQVVALGDGLLQRRGAGQLVRRIGQHQRLVATTRYLTEIAHRVLLRRQGQRTIQRENDLRQIADAEIAAQHGFGRLHLIIADGLIEEGASVLVDQPLAHDHAGWFAEISGDPAPAKFFGDGGGGAGAAVEVGD